MTYAKRLLLAFSCIAALVGTAAMASGGVDTPNDNHVTGGSA
jgi:hypothetical protein